jgi:hypothetical protein
VSYRTSWLHPAILRGTETILITRESDPNEVRTLRGVCGSWQGDKSGWVEMFGNLALGDAAVLPITGESAEGVIHLHLAPRVETGGGMMRSRICPRKIPRVGYSFPLSDEMMGDAEHWTRSSANNVDQY